MQAGPADSRNRSEYNLPTTADYYKRFTNANTFISNNANPFLISPYSPNQVNGSNNQTIFYVNTINPLTPGSTIQVQGNMNIANGYFLSLNNDQVYTNKIYQNNTLVGGFPTSVVCDGTAETIKFNAGQSPFDAVPFEISSTQITANLPVVINPPAGPQTVPRLTVGGQIDCGSILAAAIVVGSLEAQGNIQSPEIFTDSLNFTNTTFIATAGTLAGYIPITVDIGTGAPVNYKLAVYNP